MKKEIEIEPRVEEKADYSSELKHLIQDLEGTRSAMAVYLKKEQILKFLRRLE